MGRTKLFASSFPKKKKQEKSKENWRKEILVLFSLTFPKLNQRLCRITMEPCFSLWGCSKLPSCDGLGGMQKKKPPRRMQEQIIFWVHDILCSLRVGKQNCFFSPCYYSGVIVPWPQPAKKCKCKSFCCSKKFRNFSEKNYTKLGQVFPLWKILFFFWSRADLGKRKTRNHFFNLLLFKTKKNNFFFNQLQTMAAADSQFCFYFSHPFGGASSKVPLCGFWDKVANKESWLLTWWSKWKLQSEQDSFQTSKTMENFKPQIEQPMVGFQR